MSGTLAEQISTATRSPYIGSAFRQSAPRYEPLSGEGARMHGGRYNPPMSFHVLYLCTTRACSVAELRRAGARHPIGVDGFMPRVLHRYDIELTSVLDLTDDTTCAHLDVPPATLVDDDRSVTQEIGVLAQQFGYQAVHAASAAGVGTVLAVFTDNLGSGRLAPVLVERWESSADL